MSMDVSSSKGPKGDINVTPLVDVVLVLLIIFMVITPMLEQGAQVELPRIQNASSKEDSSDDIILTVSQGGQVFYDQDAISMEALEARLGPIIAAEPNKPVLIKGDVNGRYGEVRRVMELTQRVGARQVGLMADKESRELPKPSAEPKKGG